AQAACGGGHAWAGAGADGAAGRARAADAGGRPGARGAQIHAAHLAGAVARIVEPTGRGLSGGARALPLAAVPGLALRAVLLARLDRRRAVCGRGRLSAGGVTEVGCQMTTDIHLTSNFHIAHLTHVGLSRRDCTSNMAVAKPCPSARISRITESGVG